jgi:hypothetical protein
MRILSDIINIIIFVQIHSDFVAAAIKGAMAVVDGNVMVSNL